MKKKLFSISLSIVSVFCAANIAFADIDLNLDDEEVSKGGGLNKKGYLTLKAGYDVMGEGKMKLIVTETSTGNSGSVDDEGDIDNGLSFSMEAGSRVSEVALLGIGGTFQLGRGIDEPNSEGKFQFIPLYGLVKLVFNANQVIPFGVAHIGYNLFFADDDFKGDYDTGGGLYWGIGGGVMLENGVQVELLYSQNRGKLTGNDASYEYDVALKYTKWTISAGISF